MNSPYRIALDQMVWSYSRIHCYENCPAAFKMIYLDKCSKVNNAFAEWGSLGHSLLEDYIDGNLMSYELADEYNNRYTEMVVDDFPPSRGMPLADKYYENGLEYFETFDGFPSNWNLIGAEMELNLKIGDYPFMGYIDLLVKDTDDNELIVVDHKSKAGFKNDKELREYAIQLYLYSDWVKEHYGKYPKQLVFNMFRNRTMVTVDFNEDDFHSALNWVIDTIQKIYQDVDFWDKIYIDYAKKGKDLDTYKKNDFFCKYLCGCREHCERSGEGV